MISLNNVQIYNVFKNIQNKKEVSKEEREFLIEKKYLKFDKNVKGINFEGIKMPYKITKKGHDFLVKFETIVI